MAGIQTNKPSYEWTSLFDQIVQWWELMQNPNASGNRARLRRARNPDEVEFIDAYYTLLSPILALEKNEHRIQFISHRLPLVAGLLSHVTEDTPDESLPIAMSKKKQGSTNRIISETRFRRILKTEDDSELYITLIRVIRMLGNKANVRDIATSVMFWNTETKKTWASKYYLHN